MQKKNLRYIVFFNTAAILKSVLGLIRAKLTSLWLGVEGVGILGQITTAFNFQANISDFGVFPLLINKLGKYSPDERNSDTQDFVNLSILIIFISNLFLVSSIIVFREKLSILIFNSSSYVEIIVLLAILNPIYTLSMFPENIVKSFRQFKILSIGQNITSIVGLLSIPPMLWYYGINGILYNFVIFLLFNFLFFLPFAIRAIPLSWFKIRKIKRRIIYETIKFCSVLTVRKALTYFTLIIFRSIIVHELGLKSNGYFQAAWSISNYLNVLFTAFVVYLFPTLSSIRDLKMFNKELNRNLEYLIYIILPFILVIVAMPELFLTLLFNPTYVSVKNSLNILTVLKLWEAFYIFFSVVFVSQNRLRALIVCEIIKSGLLVIISALVVSPLNLSGAVLSIAISDVVSVMAVLYFSSKDPMLKLNETNKKNLLKFSFIFVIAMFPYSGKLWPRIIQEIVVLFLALYVIDLKKYVMILREFIPAKSHN